jgi:hypothetical protein
LNGGTAAEGAHRAAAEVVRIVLRRREGDSAQAAAETAVRGGFESVAACARRLARATGAEVSTARAFGGEWPVIEGAGWLVAPAMPLALTAAGGDGLDAGYRLCDGAVWREAAGVERLFLTTEAAGPDAGAPFDLLWFGDSERYTFRRGILAVDDLFAEIEIPVDHATLERLLVRARRVDAAVLDGLAFDRPEAPAVITVNRGAALTPAESWRDPERFLRSRADVERTARRGDHIDVETVGGAAAAFLCEDRDDGWTVRLDAGDYPLTALSLRRLGVTLSLSAVLHPAVDPLAPGMRGRLAFDLRSDLVALSAEERRRARSRTRGPG